MEELYPSELAWDFTQNIFDHTVEPATFPWVSKSHKILVISDEFGFRSAERRVVIYPIIYAGIVAPCSLRQSVHRSGPEHNVVLGPPSQIVSV